MTNHMNNRQELITVSDSEEIIGYLGKSPVESAAEEATEEVMMSFEPERFNIGIKRNKEAVEEAREEMKEKRRESFGIAHREYEFHVDVDAEEIVEELEERKNPESEIREISGVGPYKVKKLEDAGFESKKDVKKASQSELADIGGIGNALAARIKADVGNIEKRSFLKKGTLTVNE